MEKLEQELMSYKKTDIDKALKHAYATSLKDPGFEKLVKKLKLKENILYKYTSKLERTVCELKNCENCKGLAFCKNPTIGFVYYPAFIDGKISFSYIACKYKKEVNKNKSGSIFYELPSELKSASMKNIDVTDKTRVKAIKWLKEFYDNYLKDNKTKGLYLHGSFGSGKTYMIVAMLNELAKKKVKVAAIYYPTLLRNLKESFKDDYSSRLEYISKVDILLLDDIGAENVTPWGRDEILGSILQYRMDNNLATFFTSNLTIEELEKNLASAKGELDKVKARRIIERIKQLTIDMELVSKNRRV